MKLKRRLSQTFNVAIASLFALGVTVPALLVSSVASAADLTSTSIQMNSSTPGAAGVEYKVTFTPSTSEGATGVVVIDFCSNSPLDGDPCDYSYATVPDVQSVAGPATTTALKSATAGLYTTVQITGQTLTSGTAYTATLTGITNPTTAGTFYARVYTGASGYTYTPAASSGGSPTSTGFADNTGVALSTANVVSIQARVMPTLQFCVSAAVPTASCGGTTAPDIQLGTGSPPALSSSTLSTGSVYSQLSTNAANGANITGVLNNTTCDGLETSVAEGSNCIGPVDGGANAATSMSAGTAAFGLNVGNSTNASGGTNVGTLTAQAPYSTASEYAMSNQTGSTDIVGTFGATLATSTGPTANINNEFTFAASITPTTTAGLYTANVSLIATGTF